MHCHSFSFAATYFLAVGAWVAPPVPTPLLSYLSLGLLSVSSQWLFAAGLFWSLFALALAQTGTCFSISPRAPVLSSHILSLCAFISLFLQHPFSLASPSYVSVVTTLKYGS